MKIQEESKILNLHFHCQILIAIPLLSLCALIFFSYMQLSPCFSFVCPFYGTDPGKIRVEMELCQMLTDLLFPWLILQSPVGVEA